MADIKTRDAVKGTIKTIDKAAIATERMKSAYPNYLPRKTICTEKQDYRIFKLTRIITLEMLSDTFDKKSFPELDEMSGQVYSTIVLRFAKEISYRVYDEFDNTQISTGENGDLIVSVEMPEDEWLIGYLLSFGTQVDIVEPAHLKDIVAKQAKSIYEKYKS